MKKLTFYQKEFLLTFFQNSNYHGWRNIAVNLLDKGECIVAGTNCIWHGGIGNFIKTEIAENAYECLVYKFDLENFLNSEWYKERSNNEISMLSSKKRALEEELEDICKL